MAKEMLPVNFMDDILDPSMNGKRRFNMIQNDDGTVSFEDATDYSQIGSDFGQKQVNQTNQAVNESADKNRIIDDLDDIAANTQAGMMAGALAVRQLNRKSIQVTTKSYPITFKSNAYLGTLLGEMSIPYSEIEENGDIMSVQVQCADNAPGSVKWSVSGGAIYVVATSIKSISANIVVTYLKYD